MSAATALPQAGPAQSTAAVDAPIFDPRAFRLDAEQAELLDRVRHLAATRFAPRAAAYDREASFPTENYRDLREGGLLAICIPKAQDGLGASYLTYSLAGAEIGRYDGATALSWNMHVCSTLWSGPLADDLDMDAGERAAHSRRRCFAGASSSKAPSIRSRSARAARRRPKWRRSAPRPGQRRAAGGSPAPRSSPACRATPTITASSARSGAATRSPPGATRSTSRCRRTRPASRSAASGTRSACARPLPYLALPGRVRA